MLRVSIRLSRAYGRAPDSIANARRLWHAAVKHNLPGWRNSRGYADQTKPSIHDSNAIVFPGSASSKTSEPLPPGPVATSINSKLATPATPVLTTPPSHDSPLVSPADKVVPPPPPPPSQAPKPRRFFRKFFTSLTVLGVLGYGGGVYYSRINDNFHDFFTEYVPFGEEAVLYLEEREFRKHFPARSSLTPRDNGESVKIPSQSGVSWKISEDYKPGSSGRHVDATTPDKKMSDAINTPVEGRPTEKIRAIEAAEKDAAASNSPAFPSHHSPEPQAVTKPTHPLTHEPAPDSTLPVAVPFIAPEVDQPSKFPPEITHIDPINIKDANEPLVQDLVKIINNIITVVNADNSNAKFSSTIGKAKQELAQVGSRIITLKQEALKDAEAKINAEKEEFDRAAKELIRRVEAEMQTQQANWQEEYQTERQKIQENYELKLKLEIERAHQVNEQRLRNALLEQAVELQNKFNQEIKDRVEDERNGRLGKLTDLSNTVHELEKLTTDWNSVVDANLKTQHLHVAVEAVRANLEKSQVPRPFVRELTALREIASGDSVVNAAIASINPIAYQRGIPSSAQLIDRFRRVATEVRKAALLPEDAGVASHASSYLLSKLLFKKKGIAIGSDVESVLTRTETFLEEGNLDAAAREMNTLKGWARTLSRDWLGECRRVLEVRQALDVIATEARLQSLRIE